MLRGGDRVGDVTLWFSTAAEPGSKRESRNQRRLNTWEAMEGQCLKLISKTEWGLGVQTVSGTVAQRCGRGKMVGVGCPWTGGAEK